MNFSINRVVTFSCCIGLMACGGSGTGNIVPGGDSFEDLIIQGEALTAKLEGLDPTEVMPGSGEVTYNGVIVIVDDIVTSSAGVVGSTTLTANFGTEVISGNSDNFYATLFDEQGDPIGIATSVLGDLSHYGTDFSGGAVIIDTNGDVVLEGTLRTIDGQMFAVFAGGGADMITGVGFDMPAGAINVDAFMIAD